tara:strand:+ start:138 stop:392 length:255 start_codon:yes stop_codon:yes gene_type:complete
MKKYKYLLPLLRKSLPFILKMPFVRKFIKFSISIIFIYLFIPSHWITVFFTMVLYALIGGISFSIIGNILMKLFSTIYAMITSK